MDIHLSLGVNIDQWILRDISGAQLSGITLTNM